MVSIIDDRSQLKSARKCNYSKLVRCVIIYCLLKFRSVADADLDTSTFSADIEPHQFGFHNPRRNTHFQVNATQDYSSTDSPEIFDDRWVKPSHPVDDLKRSDTERIVGGQAIAIEKVPSYVSISRWGRLICTGNLISVRHVLTAAHCVTEIFSKPIGNKRYRVTPVSGLTSRIGSTSFKHGGVRKYTRKIAVHPDFLTETGVGYNRDVAIITLWREVRLSGTVKIAKIHPEVDNDEMEEMAGTKCLVAGWGMTKYGGKASERIRAVKITVFSPTTCKLYYGHAVAIRYHICTFDIGKDTCRGDSGSGIFCNESIIGVTSWGIKCDSGFPAVYARVDNVKQFISDVLNGAGLKQISFNLLFFFIVSTLFSKLILNKFSSIG